MALNLEFVSKKESKALKILCDKSFLHQAFFHGRHLSSLSEETLKLVLESYPYDVSARAELLAFYAHRCFRFNVLGLDPVFEHQFATHLLWFISHAPGAQALDQIRIPDLSHRTKELIEKAWKKCVEIYGSDSAIEHNRIKCLERLRINSDAKNRILARGRKKQGFGADLPKVMDEGIEILTQMSKFHPRNRKLKSRIEHLKKLRHW